MNNKEISLSAYIEHLLPVGRAASEQRRRFSEPRVVHKDIHAAMLVFDLRKHGEHFVFLGDVTLYALQATFLTLEAIG